MDPERRLNQRIDDLRRYFDERAAQRARWKRKNRYYYRKLEQYYGLVIPAGAKVLEIGSGDGDLLASLKPSRGVGIDLSGAAVSAAAQKHPKLEFRSEAAETFRLRPGETFDFIVLSDLVGHLDDVQKVFENLHQACTPSTRIVMNYYNYLWEPALRLGSILGLRMNEKIQNWLSLQDLENLFYISGFETITKMRKVLLPVGIPLFSDAVNRFIANQPFVNRLCLLGFIVSRVKPKPAAQPKPPSISIVIPCRNEKGNIEELVRRIPDFPGESEILFVDGRSTDGTLEEINRVAEVYHRRPIRTLVQEEATGKGGAVRLGFEESRGDILIILDGDISVPPESLVKFYDQLVSRNGEFINGTRMVYPMEKQAMRFLNVGGNKFFSLAFSYLLDQRIKDTLCGTKALYRSDYQKIAQNRAFFGDFDPFGDFDLLFGAAKLNLKIVEVPVRYFERRYGTTKIHRFRHGLLLLRMCLIATLKLKFI